MKPTRNRPLAGLILGASLVLASGAQGEERHAGGACSNADLKGTFGFYRAGTTAVGGLAAVGILSFDGKGHSSVLQSVSRGGDLSFDEVGDFLYHVNSDCTGNGSTTDGDEFTRLVVVDDGNGFYIFSETEGNAVYGVGTKIHSAHRDGGH
jgi:hypothetical protein